MSYDDDQEEILESALEITRLRGENEILRLQNADHVAGLKSQGERVAELEKDRDWWVQSCKRWTSMCHQAWTDRDSARAALAAAEEGE